MTTMDMPKFKSKADNLLFFLEKISRMLKFVHKQSLRAVDEETKKAEGISSAVPKPRFSPTGNLSLFVRRSNNS